MANPAPLSLSAGDRVVYPNQGVCRVTGVDEKEVAGQKLVFVTMRREEDGAVMMVPQGKLEANGVRKVAGPEEVEEIFAFLQADTEKADLDWKQRARTNLDRMSTGGLHGVAEVVKGLQILSELRPLPAKERELYDNARHLLVSEISAALAVDPCTAEDAIDVALFPPGKERPKRTAEEFRVGGAGEDELDLSGDLLGLDADLGIPEEPEEAPEEEEAAEAGEGEEEEEAPAAKKAPAKKRAEAAEAAPAAPKKRGRPPKAKPVEAAEAAPAAPKKRGRPPKAKPAEEQSEPTKAKKKK